MVSLRVKAAMVDCKITHTHLTLGIKGNPPFLDVSTAYTYVFQWGYRLFITRRCNEGW